MAYRRIAADLPSGPDRGFQSTQGHDYAAGARDSPSAETMIERVARAIAALHGSDDWRAFLGDARAAAAAMREPTAAMLDAAVPEMPDWGYLPEDWQAMIDYVLRERPN